MTETGGRPSTIDQHLQKVTEFTGEKFGDSSHSLEESSIVQEYANQPVDHLKRLKFSERIEKMADLKLRLMDKLEELDDSGEVWKMGNAQYFNLLWQEVSQEPWLSQTELATMKLACQHLTQVFEFMRVLKYQYSFIDVSTPQGLLQRKQLVEKAIGKPLVEDPQMNFSVFGIDVILGAADANRILPEGSNGVVLAELLNEQTDLGLAARNIFTFRTARSLGSTLPHERQHLLFYHINSFSSPILQIDRNDPRTEAQEVRILKESWFWNEILAWIKGTGDQQPNFATTYNELLQYAVGPQSENETLSEKKSRLLEAGEILRHLIIYQRNLSLVLEANDQAMKNQAKEVDTVYFLPAKLTALLSEIPLHRGHRIASVFKELGLKIPEKDFSQNVDNDLTSGLEQLLQGYKQELSGL